MLALRAGAARGARFGTKAMKDRRRDIRILEENKVLLTVPADRDPARAGEVFYSFTRDISVGGARILTGARLEPGERVRLEIALSGSRRSLRMAAEVRWVREVYEGEVFEVGLAFVNVDPEAEIALIDHVYGRARGKSPLRARARPAPERDPGKGRA
jgi:uncharacterized protein (TIGR02266 family)